MKISITKIRPRGASVLPYMMMVAFMCLAGCGDSPGGSALNLFSLEDEILLGRQVEQQVLSNPNYPVLNPEAYPQAYRYMQRMLDQILESGAVVHRDAFEWKLYIINEASTLNAFCAPGGKIFVFTGLINFLERGSSLAGVLGHEIAHADQRHSSEQLTKQYGISTLMSILTGGEGGQLAELAQGLVSLSFSRSDEAEADKYSVIYLCNTEFDADGAADFFEKLLAEGQTPGVPEFLSTHPSPENRVPAIRQAAVQLSCGHAHEHSGNENTPDPAYDAFKQSLPGGKRAIPQRGRQSGA